MYARKSIVVAVVIIASILPVIFFTFQTPPQMDVNDADTPLTHEEWIEWYRNADPAELGHRHNQIVRDTWVAQYEFEQEFHPQDGFVVEYLSALVIQREMLLGTYDHTDEKLTRYHDWLLDTFDVPDTPEGVDRAMLDLVGGDPDHLHRIERVHYHNHRATMIAEPPFDLWESDPEWWGLQNQLSACRYNEPPNCEEFVWAYENNRPLTAEELALMQPGFDEAERQWRADKEAGGR